MHITDFITFDVAACGSVAQWVKPVLHVCRGHGMKNSAHWYDELLGLRTAAQCSKAPSGSVLRQGEARLGVTWGRGAASPGLRDVLGQCDDGARGWEQQETKRSGELPWRPAQGVAGIHVSLVKGNDICQLALNKSYY